jgi:hypothetical protein
MTMTTRWNVQIGEIREEISGDLLKALGYREPYSNDETHTARYDNYFTGLSFPVPLASAFASGLHGDDAALQAIRMMDERRAANEIETSRQKVAEINLQAAQERRAAEGIALARERERTGARRELA